MAPGPGGQRRFPSSPKGQVRAEPGGHDLRARARWSISSTTPCSSVGSTSGATGRRAQPSSTSRGCGTPSRSGCRRRGRELTSRTPSGAARGTTAPGEDQVGIQVLEFPHWFVCQNRAAARSCAATADLKGERYWHQCDRTKRPSACRCGSLARANGGTSTSSSGSGSPTRRRRRRCPRRPSTSRGRDRRLLGDRHRCACGASEQAVTRTSDIEPPCFGERPWLGPEGSEDCEEKLRLLVRTASNSYFPQVVSALSIPEHGRELEQPCVRSGTC